jgi:asparagine synthase (glutamine-hydrolysing)
MCGITGIFSPHHLPPDTPQILGHLTALVSRRGPDDEGTWTDGSHCALGFRRLAILDLSPTGHQPMLTADGRYALVYNGEMYNYLEMKRELERDGVYFRSSGDTEVVLYALAHWGTKALERFNGMFALALYDTMEKRLLLARDHAGIKPLYYLHTAQGVVFGSQYDQLLAHPWSRDHAIRPDALALYLQFGYIPAPYAMLESTAMLEPGYWIEFSITGIRQGAFFTFPRFQQPDLFGEAAYEAVDAAITTAVRQQMQSDVPLGAFLSGGIDSPLVVAKMAHAHQGGAVKAFTLATDDADTDESKDGRRYASELPVEHFVEPINEASAYAMLDDVAAACGEPFADYSIFPTMTISKAARKHVTVMLSGDGGDELFWGYVGRFGSVIQKAADFGHPRWVRNSRWAAKRFFNVGNGYYPLRFPTLGNWYAAKHSITPHSWLRALFPDTMTTPESFDLFSFASSDTEEVAQWVRWNEFVGHLTRVLLKVDRASMYHGLEVRVPLLDKDVIETALRVDWRSCLDLDQQIGKLPLRKSLARHISHQTRQKRGFSVPMERWLKTSLRPVIEDCLLNRTTLAGQPFDGAAARQIYESFLQTGHGSWGLWGLLSLALWEERHSKVAHFPQWQYDFMK